MSHFASLIPLFGTPSQWSTDTTEKNHIATFKDAYASTNRAENYEEQMLRYGIRHDTFIQHELQSNAVLSDDDDEENDNETSPWVQLKSLHYTKPSRHGVAIKTVLDLDNLLGIDCFYAKLSCFLESKGLRASEAIDVLAVKVFHWVVVTVGEFATEEQVTQTIRCTINKL